MKITKSELREIIHEEISKLNRTSTRLTSLVNEEEGRIKNPKTGRTIKISTALGYDPSHPAYKIAAKQGGDVQPRTGKPASKVAGDKQPSSTGKPTKSRPAALPGVDFINSPFLQALSKVRQAAEKMNKKEAKLYVQDVQDTVSSIDKSKTAQKKIGERMLSIGKDFAKNLQPGWSKNSDLSKEERELMSDAAYKDFWTTDRHHQSRQKLIDFSKKNPNSPLSLKPEQINQLQKYTSLHDKHQNKINKNLRRYGVRNRDDLDSIANAVTSVRRWRGESI